jgi:hypothetical protein
MNTNQIEAFAQGYEVAYAIVDATRAGIVASGVLTTNTAIDFGPALAVSASGDVMLCWERTKTLSILGEAGNPAAILSCFWNGTNWSQPQTLVANLTGLYGWRAAAFSPNRAAVAYTLDQDGDLEGANDQEVYLVQCENGVWGGPRRLTNNNQADNSPQLAYLADGRLAVGWLNGGRVSGLIGDLDAAPRVWIEANDFLGLNFCRAELARRDNRLFAIWPAASDLYAIEIPLSGPPSGRPQVLREDPGDVETAFAAEVDAEGNLRYAAIVTPVLPLRLPELAPLSGVRSETFRFGAVNAVAPRILAFAPPTGGKARITWASAVGSGYVLQQSTDLRAWTDVAELAATTVQSSLDVTIPANAGQIFFRLKTK